MPNVKIYVEESLLAARHNNFKAMLKPLRDTLMAEFSAPQSVCHLTLVPALGLEDQTRVLVDVHYLSMPERTPEMAEQAAQALRAVVVRETGEKPAVRAISLGADIYVALG
ncbi:hypothetical protein [Roseovarius sp.]|uniref:hypothetical protein n=1 Tax=Roseovarius sp. TaxID=1486281 RepID=UPI003A97C28C